jgi:hypothetical protein
MSVSYTFNGVANKVSAQQSEIRKNMNAALQNLETGYRQITLTAAAEASNAIVVTGQVTDAYGTAITAATSVLVRSLAVTADKGDITVVSGTEVKTVNPSTGFNESWITTTSSGAFSVSIANTVAEGTLVTCSTNDGYTAHLVLTFA